MSIIYEKHDLYPESIIIRKFIGKVTVNDIIDSWEYLNENKVINENTKGLINNFTSCELIMEMESFETLMSYMKKQTYIKNVKIAVISDNPKTIIYPILGYEQERELKIRPFSTMEAAVSWISMDI